MERAGLARGARHGRESVWKSIDETLRKRARHLDQISAQWDKALARLQSFIGEPFAGQSKPDGQSLHFRVPYRLRELTEGYGGVFSVSGSPIWERGDGDPTVMSSLGNAFLLYRMSIC